MQHTQHFIRTIGALVIISAAGAAFAQTQGATQGTERCPDVTALETQAKATPKDAKALVSLGQAYLCTGRFRDAQLTLEEAIRVDFRNFDAHFHLGRALYEQGDYDAALLEYNQLATLYPDRMEPYYQQGVMYARLRKPDESINAFLKALDAGRKLNVSKDVLVDTYLALASQYRIKRDFDGAARTYGQALELRPGDAAINLARAQAFFDAGKLNDALPIVFDVLKTNPANTGAVLLIADIYDAQGLPDRALREIDRGLETIKPARERASLFLRRGFILQKAGRSGEAVNAFTAATDANPDSWEAQYNLGVLLLPSRPSDALTRFRNAARIRPEDGDTQLAISTAQEALKNYPAAYTAAKAAILLLPRPEQKARARFQAGRSAYLAGQFADAATEFRQLVAADANNYTYQLWYGLTLYQLKDLPGAIAALEAATKINPTAVEARTTLGAVYFAAKRFADAETVLRGVLQQDANNVDALTNLGLALANLNRIEEACTALTRAANLGSATARRAADQLKCK
jgi:tetratricopeptide (TPR) repeat protein